MSLLIIGFDFGFPLSKLAEDFCWVCFKLGCLFVDRNVCLANFLVRKYRDLFNRVSAAYSSIVERVPLLSTRQLRMASFAS